jgi:hypothetical protein
MAYEEALDLHVNVPLTNVSVAYMQSAELHRDKVFPKVPVQKQSDLYWKYSKSDWRRTDVQQARPEHRVAGCRLERHHRHLLLPRLRVHKDIDDQLRANADSNFNLDRDATEFITNQHAAQAGHRLDGERLLQDRRLGHRAHRRHSAPRRPASSCSGTRPGSDPISDVAGWIIDFRRLTGFAPNVCVMGAYVMEGAQAAPGHHRPDQVHPARRRHRGPDRDPVRHRRALRQLRHRWRHGPADQRRRHPGRGRDLLLHRRTHGVLFGYAPSSPSLLTPSAGYTFTWSGYLGGNSEGIRIKRSSGWSTSPPTGSRPSRPTT